MRKRAVPRCLLVEGDEDKRVVPELVEANGIPWGDTRDEAIVDIESVNGVDELLKPGLIETKSKSSGLRMLGILADANGAANRRWLQFRQRCQTVFPGLPELLPQEGLVHVRDDGLRFGIFLMPDNRSPGMLETFLTYLVRPDHEALFTYATDITREAERNGACFSPSHFDKARIHAFLAWLDPPGRQLHQALMCGMLDPGSPSAQAFIHWFRSLYLL